MTPHLNGSENSRWIQKSEENPISSQPRYVAFQLYEYQWRLLHLRHLARYFFCTICGSLFQLSLSLIGMSSGSDSSISITEAARITIVLVEGQGCHKKEFLMIQLYQLVPDFSVLTALLHQRTVWCMHAPAHASEVQSLIQSYWTVGIPLKGSHGSGYKLGSHRCHRQRTCVVTYVLAEMPSLSEIFYEELVQIIWCHSKRRKHFGMTAPLGMQDISAIGLQRSLSKVEKVTKHWEHTEPDIKYGVTWPFEHQLTNFGLDDVGPCCVFLPKRCKAEQYWHFQDISPQSQ